MARPSESESGGTLKEGAPGKGRGGTVAASFSHLLEKVRMRGMALQAQKGRPSARTHSILEVSALTPLTLTLSRKPGEGGGGVAPHLSG